MGFLALPFAGGLDGGGFGFLFSDFVGRDMRREQGPLGRGTVVAGRQW